MADDEPLATGDAAALYNRVAARYGHGLPVFDYFGRRLVEVAGIAPGSRVLDVAAGRGAVLFPAAEKVGAPGRVVGIDAAAAMVEETTAEIERRGIANAAMRRMDAEQLAFPAASFDAVLCGFAIFFLDIERALAEFQRVLRPGGTLALTSSGGGDERWRWYNGLLLAYHDRYGVPLSPPRRGRAWGAEDLPGLLNRAGFDVARDVVEESECVYADDEEWWAAKWTHGARYPLEHMPPDVLARFKGEAFAALNALRQPDGLHEPWRIRCTVGMKRVR